MSDVYRLLRELEEQRGQAEELASDRRTAAAPHQQSFRLERELCTLIQEMRADVEALRKECAASSSKYRRLAEDAFELAEQLRDHDERSVVLEVAATFARVAARYERQERTARPG